MAELRHLGIGDLAPLCRLQSCIDPPWSETLLRQRLGQSGGLNLGLVEAGELVAFALIGRLFDEAELLQVAVVPSRRRRGLACRLLDMAMIELSRAGVSRLMLEVRASNAAAIALYRASGFDEDGRRPNYYPVAGGREDALLMSRRLADGPR